ncbi:MAG: hypothetical protein JST85_25095 [Acidobacteria bacterium]|nr:hypothetical protein [Acidobacteriota bacterium]
MHNTRFIFRNALIVALFSFAAVVAACNKGSVVSDSAPQQPASQQPPAQAAGQQNAATPPVEAQNAQPQQPTPSPTLHPVMKAAQANPGVPVSIPDSLRRPLTPEEMKKAMEAMPPEVRARLQGMAVAPQGAKPQATATPKK